MATNRSLRCLMVIGPLLGLFCAVRVTPAQAQCTGFFCEDDTNPPYVTIVNRPGFAGGSNL